MPLLSVLDQSPVRSGGTPADAIHESLELAELADRLGYHRSWLAEHHWTPGLGGSSPEVLIGQVAARTSRIRVGAGGVMLQHASALKVAETFRVLETLFPGRIDLGIGRAPGADHLTTLALEDRGGDVSSERGTERRSAPAAFPRQVADVIGFLRASFPEGHRYGKVIAMPSGPTVPEVWLLGSSDVSAALAAHFGTAFSFAHFINDEGGAPITRGYAAAFRPSPLLSAPRASVAVFVVCADSEAEALRLARSRDLFVVRLYTGRAGPYPSVEEAEAYPYAARELRIVEQARRRTIAGAPAEVRERLRALADAYGVDELVSGTLTEEPRSLCCVPAPPVLEFDPTGNLLQAWGGPGQGYDWPAVEHGIFVDYQGHVWIGGNGERDHQLLKLTRDGKLVLQIGRAGMTGGDGDTPHLGRPAHGTVDPATNEVFVADGYKNHRVIVFDAQTGAYKRHWGADGRPPGDASVKSFGNPVHCVRLARDGLLYVCDRANNRIQVFRKDGTFVKEFVVAPATRGGGSVWDLDVSPDAPQTWLYNADGENNHVWTLLRDNGQVVSKFGRNGRQAGHFHWVHNLAVDSKGNIYTTEVDTGKRAQKFVFNGVGPTEQP